MHPRRESGFAARSDQRSNFIARALDATRRAIRYVRRDGLDRRVFPLDPPKKTHQYSTQLRGSATSPVTLLGGWDQPHACSVKPRFTRFDTDTQRSCESTPRHPLASFYWLGGPPRCRKRCLSLPLGKSIAMCSYLRLPPRARRSLAAALRHAAATPPGHESGVIGPPTSTVGGTWRNHDPPFG
jgi:hypothetical protein